jgi:pimeloyl-ACP methyl ester carboxylesterase
MLSSNYFTPVILATAACILAAPAARADDTKFLDLPKGRVAYSDSGGPGTVIICVPGIGDTRAEYRFLAPLLIQAGYRVITVDPRGMGESSVSFDDYSAAAVGSDVAALIKAENFDSVYVVGNSAAGASAVWVAAELPDRVRGIALIDPFVRDMPTSFWARTALSAAMHRPWGPAFWSMYYGSLYKAAPPKDLPEYRQALEANLKEPGRFEALQAMLWAPKGPCEARIKDVRAPALVVMGGADPDFDNPATEASLVAGLLHGKVLMVPGAGHYPHVEQPKMVANEIISFTAKASR